MTVDLDSGVRVSGIVKEGPDGHPAQGVEVRLEPYVPMYGDLIDWRDDRWGLDDESITVKTGVQGRFRIGGVNPGRYRVEARRSFYVSDVHEEVVVDGENVALDFALPASASLVGRLLPAKGLDAKDYVIRARPSEIDEEDLFLVDLALIPHARLEENGAFRVGPLPEGELDILLYAPNPYTGGRWYPGNPSIDVGTTVLTQDGPPLELDPGALTPGWIDVRVLVNGMPDGDVTLGAQEVDGEDWRAVGEDGRIGPVPPGLWRVHVGSPQWIGAEPTSPIEVVAGETARVEIPVTVHSGQVRVVSASSGEPLKGRRLMCTRDGSSMGWQVLFTDERGVLAAELPVGTYGVNDHGPVEPAGAHWPPTGRKATLEWTVTGPVVEELALDEARPR